MPRLIAVFLTAAAVLWAVAVVAAPLQSATADVPVVRGLIVWGGHLVCHQRPERSFHVAGVQLPVCARCTGLYLSGAIGALLGWLGAGVEPRRARRALLWAAVPTALTVLAEWFGLAAPPNLVRAVAALPLGGLSAWVFVRMLRAESSPSTWATIA